MRPRLGLSAIAFLAALVAFDAHADDGTAQHCKWVRRTGSCNVSIVNHDPNTHYYTITGAPGICKKAAIYLGDGSVGGVFAFYGASTEGSYMVIDKTKPIPPPTPGDCATFESVEEADARCAPATKAASNACKSETDQAINNKCNAENHHDCVAGIIKSSGYDCMSAVIDAYNSCLGWRAGKIDIFDDGKLVGWKFVPGD